MQDPERKKEELFLHFLGNAMLEGTLPSGLLAQRVPCKNALWMGDCFSAAKAVWYNLTICSFVRKNPFPLSYWQAGQRKFPLG